MEARSFIKMLSIVCARQRMIKLEVVDMDEVNMNPGANDSFSVVGTTLKIYMTISDNKNKEEMSRIEGVMKQNRIYNHRQGSEKSEPFI